MDSKSFSESWQDYTNRDKMLTLGGLGIWWLVDVYVAAKEAGRSW